MLEDGASAVLAACHAGQLDVVRYLVESGADKDQALGDGTSPVYIASEHGHLAIVKYLVESGADKDRVDEDGASPVLGACYQGHLEVVRFLVEAGADKDKAKVNGASPLYIASQNGHAEVVRYLVGAGVDKDRALVDGATPLYIASQVCSACGDPSGGGAETLGAPSRWGRGSMEHPSCTPPGRPPPPPPTTPSHPFGPPKILQHGWVSIFEQAAPLAGTSTERPQSRVAAAGRHVSSCGPVPHPREQHGNAAPNPLTGAGSPIRCTQHAALETARHPSTCQRGGQSAEAWCVQCTGQGGVGERPGGDNGSRGCAVTQRAAPTREGVGRTTVGQGKGDRAGGRGARGGATGETQGQCEGGSCPQVFLGKRPAGAQETDEPAAPEGGSHLGRMPWARHGAAVDSVMPSSHPEVQVIMCPPPPRSLPLARPLTLPPCTISSHPL